MDLKVLYACGDYVRHCTTEALSSETLLIKLNKTTDGTPLVLDGRISAAGGLFLSNDGDFLDGANTGTSLSRFVAIVVPPLDCEFPVGLPGKLRFVDLGICAV